MEEKEMLLLVGIRIKHRRFEVNISQDELANRVGMSSRLVSRLETGEALPSILRLKKITDALDYSLSDLFRGF
jgi:transcriptional regulator with XRE-family HTH domain